jgi:hypothetical protein
MFLEQSHKNEFGYRKHKIFLRTLQKLKILKARAIAGSEEAGTEQNNSKVKDREEFYCSCY